MMAVIEGQHVPRRQMAMVMVAVCSLLMTVQAFHIPLHTSTSESTTSIRILSRRPTALFAKRSNNGGGGGAVAEKTSSVASPAAAAAAVPAAKVKNVDPPPGYVVGDTKGAALLVENVAISRGSNIIVKNVSLRVEPKQRWAIVGPNGAGKSTLLGAITGTILKDEGRALVAPKTKVGYLKQTAVAGSTKTVGEEASSGMEEIVEARRVMDLASDAILNGDTSTVALQKMADTTEQFEAVGGYTQEQLVDSVLGGLGFTPADTHRACGEFSGGWQMRIALAKLLLSQPQLLLLDEPSNHLDSAARSWLANYLSNYQHSMILVSHDLTLLQQSVNNIAEVAGQTLLTYSGCNYEKYLFEKEFRAKSAWAEYERNLEEAKKLQSFVDRFGASATKASQAQSRVKMIEKMRLEGKLTPPPTAVVETRRAPKLQLPAPPRAIGEELISLRSADIGHDSNEAPLLTNISLDIKRGMKLLLRGPNGAGKSTLMAALRGKLPLLSGERIENVKLRLGVFTQDLAQELDVKARAVDLVLEHARGGKFGDVNISDQDARNTMGLLGLSQDKPLRLVGDLSGGEKARVALSMFALKASNLLMLDEPSNHLDVECIAALGDSLSSWDNSEKGAKDGAVVVISHDQSFCETVGFTHVGTVQDGVVTIEQRGLLPSDWVTYDMEAAEALEVLSTEEDTTITNIAAESTKKPIIDESNLAPWEKKELAENRKKAFNAPKRIKRLELNIEQCETKIAALEKEMMDNGANVAKLMDLTNQKEEQEKVAAKALQEWEELEELLLKFG
jgi:ATP-binding cassette subfamily F protein 3